MNSVNETLIDRGGIDGTIYEAAGPVFLNKCQKFRWIVKLP